MSRSGYRPFGRTVHPPVNGQGWNSTAGGRFPRCVTRRNMRRAGEAGGWECRGATDTSPAAPVVVNCERFGPAGQLPKRLKIRRRLRLGVVYRVTKVGIWAGAAGRARNSMRKVLRAA